MKDHNQPLRLRLQPIVDASIPEFHEQCKLTNLKFYGFDTVNCEEWYLRFLDRVFDSIGKEYLPIFRMFDGEYAFILGHPVNILPIHRISFKQLLRRIRYRFSKTAHKSGASQYGWETYTHDEHELVIKRFTENVHVIAQRGILALGLHDRPISTTYLPMLFDWFDDNNILIDQRNYVHFYFVYALVHGQDRYKLFKDKNVLIVTGLTDKKKLGIEQGLNKLNVASTQFLNISSNKAMLERLDLTLIKGQVDVVLVGAGVGSANILVQLEPLQTLCIDVGFALSTLANPDLRWIRPFCVPDAEFDLSKAKFL